jgi:MerR family glutamine synthetase transcriptional repressor
MGPVEKDVPLYPIGIVQELVDLSGRQIRYYEKKGLISPGRTKGNQRLYSQNDIDALSRIKQLMAEGLTLEGFRQQLEANKAGMPTTSEQPDAIVAKSPTLMRSQLVSQIDSLYPVRNQAALVRLLAARRALKDENEHQRTT